MYALSELHEYPMHSSDADVGRVEVIDVDDWQSAALNLVVDT
jgi:hypothetical protein